MRGWVGNFPTCPRVGGVADHRWEWSVPLTPWRGACYRCRKCGERRA